MCLRHPNIITLIGKCHDESQYLIITEYLEKRSLKTVLETKSVEFNKSSLLKMALDISRAIYYLHTRKPPVYHRDLKSSISISTSIWMAPEFLNKWILTDKSNIYSFGIFLWEIVTRGTVPFKNIDWKSFLIGDDAMNKRPVISVILT